MSERAVAATVAGERPEVMERSKEATKHIAFLDYLRIYAFISVLIGHKFGPALEAIVADASSPLWLRLLVQGLVPLVKDGGVGVVVFFLVSGYIITHVLRTETTGVFLVRRAFRIYPLYIVAVLIEYARLLSVGTAPGLGTLFPQLLLIGDFFNTPYAVGGVEWTLRLEVFFYLYMATIRGRGMIPHRMWRMPIAYALMVVLAGFVAPLPNIETWSKGYITIYGVFLFQGSVFYLWEQKQISVATFAGFSLLVLAQHYYLLDRFQAKWIPWHFASVGMAVFSAVWLLRSHLTAGRIVRFLSALTYSVYLFHNWLYDYFKWVIHRQKPLRPYSELLALIALVLFCWLMVHLVEKPGIRLGRWVVAKWKQSREGTSACG